VFGDSLDHYLCILGDFLDHRARLRSQPHSGLVDHSLHCAQGLPRPLSDLGLLSLVTYELDSYTIERRFLFLRPCYKAYTSPSSKLGDYIGMMHLTMHLSITISKQPFLDPSTTCLRHLLPSSGTKWAHFTRKEIFFFFLKSTMHYSDNLLL